ncbi:unnamed protein product [Symbiodinium natans]|uniref:Uncharacterized protein n=1 Tax=Symbiodinium natans TaxID=878477 RepID=A0A812LUB7_9DINO|nr:unnamed protein product [Symbiodinium natans]CAE7246990.1 unnamed protein product [Symbiodinium natans]
MKKVPGLRLPSAPVREQLSKDLKAWCKSTGHVLPDTQASSSTVPGTESQILNLHSADVDDGEDRQPDFLQSPEPTARRSLKLLSPEAAVDVPDWALDWAEEIELAHQHQAFVKNHEHDAKSVESFGVPSRFVERTKGGQLLHNRSLTKARPEGCQNQPSAMPAWASQWASELTAQFESQALSTVTLSAHHHLGSFGPNDSKVDWAGDLPSAQDLLSQGRKAVYLERLRKAEDMQCQRVVKAGLPVKDITDIATILYEAGLYGPPHFTKAHKSRGTLTGILVKPQFGGCVSIYAKTGKIIVDGSANAKRRIIGMLSTVSCPAQSATCIDDELPTVHAVKARLAKQ